MNLKPLRTAQPTTSTTTSTAELREPGSSAEPLKPASAPPLEAPMPPVPKADKSALTQMLNQAAARATSSTALQARVKAPWTERSVAIANAALEAANGLKGDAAVAAVVDSVLASKELKGAKISCTVAHAGETVVARGTADAVNPCSNSKLVTASYALSVLGPTHRFATDVIRGKDGSIGLKGAFDPTLTTESLVELAKALKAKGVHAVPKLFLDDSALVGSNVPAAFEHYGDQDWEYVARPEPLSVNKGAMHVDVRPGKGVGDAAVVELDQGAFTVRARVTTVAAGTPFKIGVDELDNGGVLERGKDGKAIVDVWGTIAVDYAKGKQLVMKSPAPEESFTERALFAFAAAGIEVGAVERGSIEGERIYAHKSKPLGEILRESLATSNAFDHEMFALAASAKQAGGPVTLAETAKRIEAFLHDAVGGEGTMVNASGIGNDNRLRSQDIVALLVKAGSDAKLHPLLAALASPGNKGTLKTRMLDTPAEGIFAGKTGTGDDAAALSGVMGDLAMSLLVDDSKGREGVRSALDAMAIALSTLVQERRT